MHFRLKLLATMRIHSCVAKLPSGHPVFETKELRVSGGVEDLGRSHPEAKAGPWASPSDNWATNRGSLRDGMELGERMVGAGAPASTEAHRLPGV